MKNLTVKTVKLVGIVALSVGLLIGATSSVDLAGPGNVPLPTNSDKSGPGNVPLPTGAEKIEE